MDPLYFAIVNLRQRKFETCTAICTELLEKNPLDLTVWNLKARALTEQVRLNFLDVFDEGIVETVLTEDAIATTARPGTSLRCATSHQSQTDKQVSSPAIRPVTQAGRPLSGVARPRSSLSSGKVSSTLDLALRSRSVTARPISSSAGRHLRVGTASIIADSDSQFINVSRLNLQKYSKESSFARALFEYLFHVENDTKKALEVATLSLKNYNGRDWWWHMQLGLSWLRLGQVRHAERHFRLSIQQEPMSKAYLGLVKVYVRLDQPLSALDVCKGGLEKFPNDDTLLIEMARLQESLGNMSDSVKLYKEVLQQDSSNVEAVACTGMNHFYTDQPEVALCFYRRLLQMGLHTPELYVNLGLCCFFAQQYDMALNCFQRALNFGDNHSMAELWYNLGHLALVYLELQGLTDTIWASQCFRIAIAFDNHHAEAFNNLGVLEALKGNNDRAVAFFQTANSLAPHIFESFYNQAKLADTMGDLQNAYNIVQSSLLTYSSHADSKHLFQKLKRHFESL